MLAPSAGANHPCTLDQELLAAAAGELAQRFEPFEHIIINFGLPPLWQRSASFATLIRIILEQQVSLASAKAAFDRLRATLDPLNPEQFLLLDDSTLKAIGFSNRKAGYGRNLANAIISGGLDIEALRALPDGQVRSCLTAIKGLGAWSADIFLLMALGRPDIWPRGDLALALALQRLNGLDTRPTPEELDLQSENWRPWRAVAARLLWHYYLSTPSSGKKERGGHGEAPPDHSRPASMRPEIS